MLKQLTTILRRIAKWREEHTAEFFGTNDPAKKDSIQKKIIGGWHEYTLTADGFRKGHRCFNCGKQSEGLAYMVAVKSDRPEDEREYFCSQECSTQFGILKGTT